MDNKNIILENYIHESNETRQANAQEETSNQIQSLIKQQHQMTQCIFDIVQEQQEANDLQKESNNLLKAQIQILVKQNEEKNSQIEGEKNWNKIAWVITSIIAIASVIVNAIT